jgi:uncharacterized membrane protein YfcA
VLQHPGTLPWSVLAVALLITLAVSVLHSVVGFAFGLLSTPLFLLLFPPKEVVVLTVLLMLVLNGLIIARGWRAVAASELRGLALPAMCGLPIGLYILLVASPAALRLIVGGLVLAFALAMLLGGGRRLTMWVAKPIVAGFAGGVLTTSINFNGPPVALYLVSRQLGIEVFRATVAAWLLMAHTLAVMIFAVTGVLSVELFVIALLLSPACLTGSWIGSHLTGRIPVERFQQLVLILLVVMGIVTITSSGYWP